MTTAAQNATKSAVGASPDAFVDAMSRAVSGVSIVTTDGPLGRFGLTISSMVSVSAEPPMLLICVNHNSAAHDAIRDNGVFTINVLAADQQAFAARFAGRPESGAPYAFDGDGWHAHAAPPRLRGAAAIFECKLDSAMTFGTHSIIVGRVTNARHDDVTPLLYTGRSYGRPATLN